MEEVALHLTHVRASTVGSTHSAALRCVALLVRMVAIVQLRIHVHVLENGQIMIAALQFVSRLASTVACVSLPIHVSVRQSTSTMIAVHQSAFKAIFSPLEVLNLPTRTATCKVGAMLQTNLSATN